MKLPIVTITIEGMIFEFAGSKREALDLAHAITTSLFKDHYIAGGFEKKNASVTVAEHLTVDPVSSSASPEYMEEDPE